MGKFLPLRTFWHNLHMFFDIIDFRVENNKKLFWENCFENLVSEIHKKNKLRPQNPPKIVDAFMFFFVFNLIFFVVFALFSKGSFVDT